MKGERKTFHWGLAYTFGGFVHDQHGEKHGSLQAGMVLEELRVLYLDPQATGSKLACASETSEPASNDTLPPMRPHCFLIVPLPVCGGCSYPNCHTMHLPLPLETKLE